MKELTAQEKIQEHKKAILNLLDKKKQYSSVELLQEIFNRVKSMKQIEKYEKS